ncbi:M15 family metallopeptidase [Candidatus Cyanaurora vandensis]|uniref:M15 family metallopeptidase n=1 Tax=Candidatus Cyanaurora vandensis TaxID=2714958 RepID=UPI0025806844|nr:M15 family metallopeptidase [Candidatus Cyanaurora vandensis]
MLVRGLGLILGLSWAAGCLAQGQEWQVVERLEPSLYLEMAYATPNNFLKETVYPRATCLLRTPVALKLQQAQRQLLKQGYSLKMWDCYRPLTVQKKMWAILPDDRYVADPKSGSRHNRGAAVDVTLVTAQGQSLELPTPFDDFTPKASPQAQATWSAPARTHYAILKTALTEAGFTPLATEWWHFDFTGWQAYPVSDFPLTAER